MKILKYNPSAGDSFESFCEKISNLAISFLRPDSQNQIYSNNVYCTVFESLPQKEKVQYPLPDWKTDWNEYQRAKTTIGAFYLHPFLKQSDDIFEIHFNFNNHNIIVVVDKIRQIVTSIEEMQMQWKEEGKRHKKEWNKWLLTKEGIEYTNKQKVQEQKWKEKESRFQENLKVASFHFSEGGEEKWNKSVEANSDGYGGGIINYAKVWAYLMEKEIEKLNHLTLINEVPTFVLTKDIMDSTSSEADGEGITGFMYGCAVSILSQCWKYGEQLRVLHNKQYGQTGEGVVNPAVLTLTV